ncbi:uncharacterized protein MONBRDRAFT_23718 [Monosiga brevicollis MX1]|uniref:MIR domain-containing protein n=1 Tax=Monosiga brevicollis TaxID=81824 RepID=A9UU89_MONBE|nr:uncharacterized protein MONBRDRAFT_23718 [Monosiga brevicollis MX1]EDQ91379.1 predicted protein [Monosiga brevicollis MX1]|eukprot:XP_001743801.1 hypothetical protein [Monosiga brevicollis MX1]
MAHFWMLTAALLACLVCARASGPIGYDEVTCGSTMRINHVATRLNLRSHEVAYGTGSGQQSVTLASSDSDSNDYWQIRAPNGKDCKQGARIKCGATIRLLHTATRKFLHSHQFQSPLSHNQEVSAYAREDGEGDSGDNWKVECSGTYWERANTFKLRHADTNQYLHSTGAHKFNRPIAGQREVCAVGQASRLSEWKSAEGYFIKAAKANN